MVGFGVVGTKMLMMLSPSSVFTCSAVTKPTEYSPLRGKLDHDHLLKVGFILGCERLVDLLDRAVDFPEQWHVEQDVIHELNQFFADVITRQKTEQAGEDNGLKDGHHFPAEVKIRAGLAFLPDVTQFNPREEWEWIQQDVGNSDRLVEQPERHADRDDHRQHHGQAGEEIPARPP